MATASEAIMIELEKEGCEWIKSEKFQKKEAEEQKRKEKENPMKVCVLKFDHFENIHRLDPKLPSYEGAPNFRQVPGYMVFGTGQPTKEGFQATLSHIFSDEVGAKKCLWTNMRQEPVVFLNGQSFTPRLADAMNENMEFPGATEADINWLQDCFVQCLKDKVEEGRKDRYVPDEEKGIIRYYRDTYAEHPEDRKNIEYSVHLDNDEDLVTLSGMYEQLKELGYNLSYARMPIVDEKAPSEVSFDSMVNELKDISPDTACVFNCQMGKGRTTTGMIVATLMADIAQGKNATSQFPELKADKNEFPDDEELLEEEHRLGNYEVMEQIYKYIPEARQGKAHLDHVIDMCGTPKEGGTGLQNLRDCIQWAEEKFNFERVKMKKPFWKQMSVNFIERYCYLIVFATYLKENAPKGFEQSFVLWLDIRAEIREIIANGSKNFNFM